MVTCKDCRDLLWDYEYGLLDASESQTVGAHVADCPECQAELEQVQSGRQRLKAAAVLDVVVPPFEPPVDEPQTLPLRPPSRSDRPAARPRLRRWLPAAAAVVFAVGLPYGLYRGGLGHHETTLADAQKRLPEIVAQRREVRDQLQVVARGAGNKSLRLQVFGPVPFQVGAGNPVRVLTTDFEDRLLPARVTVRLIDSEGDLLLEQKNLASAGNLFLELPGDTVGKELLAVHLEVLAEIAGEQVKVLGQLPVRLPSYTTQVSLAKPVYRPGEWVRFRTVTLDDVRLQPPDKPLKVSWVVKGPDREVLRGEGLTLDGGIGGGQLQLDPMRPDGEHTLTVTAADGRFPPVTRKFLVRRDPPTRLRKMVTFDRPSYQAGESVTAQLRVEGIAKGTTVAGLPVRARLEVDRKEVGAPQQLRTDAQGTVALSFPLPAAIQTSSAVLRVWVVDGKQEEMFVRPIPLVVPQVRVEFFPEGGDLVAGVVNRVYFRARTPCGRPTEFAGRVIDGQGREVAALTTGSGSGLGEFQFTPQAGATYAVRSDNPKRTIEKAALPPVQTSGVVLNIPAGALGAAELVRAVVRNPGAERPVLVGVYCRGRLVAHQYALLPTGGSDVQLALPDAVAGVLRVTVFDPEAQPPRPVAERLVYRQPARGLQLAAKPDKEAYRAGDHVRLTVQSRTESGAAEPAWLLVAVVNEDAFLLDDRLERNLPAHFLVLNELRQPEDLERADLSAGETPEARPAVDLFLGTQGWRRYLPRATPARAAGTTEGGILHLDSFDQNGQNLRGEAFEALARQDAALADEQDQVENKIRAAGAALGIYEDRARTGVATAGAVAFVAGCLFLLVALRRALRGRLATTPYFAGAFASVLLCLLGFSWLKATGGDHLPGGNAPGEQFATLERPLLPAPRAFALLPQLAPVLPTVDARPERLLPRADLRWYERLANIDRVVPPSESKPLRPDGGLAPFNSHGQSSSGAESPLDVREYAYAWPKGGVAGVQDVALWQPTLQAKDGSARVEFDVPACGSHYRILVNGHSGSGRLGTVEGTLTVQP
jgi:hypothetical protein